MKMRNLGILYDRANRRRFRERKGIDGRTKKNNYIPKNSFPKKDHSNGDEKREKETRR